MVRFDHGADRFGRQQLALQAGKHPVFQHIGRDAADISAGAFLAVA
ncbi:hypothetical protein [Novosphingobium rosa]|nr:hypothetical protein [Novosphingobium rosa]